MEKESDFSEDGKAAVPFEADNCEETIDKGVTTSNILEETVKQKDLKYKTQYNNA